MHHAKRPVFGNSYSVAKPGQSTTMVESHSLVRGNGALQTASTFADSFRLSGDLSTPTRPVCACARPVGTLWHRFHLRNRCLGRWHDPQPSTHHAHQHCCTRSDAHAQRRSAFAPAVPTGVPPL